MTLYYHSMVKKSKKKLRIGTKLVLTALDADKDFGSISFGVDEDDFALIKSRKRRAYEVNPILNT